MPGPGGETRGSRGWIGHGGGGLSICRGGQGDHEMGQYEQITQVIYDAIEEVNQTLAREDRLARAPDTVLVGEPGGFDSLGFVTLAVTIEEQVDRIFGESISVIDIIVMAVESERRTIASLARGIADLLEAGRSRD